MSANVHGAKRGASGGFFGSLGSFYHRRWLIRYFVQRQLSRTYRNSFLGFTWAFLGPVLMVVLLTLVFSEIIGIRVGREIAGAETLNFGLYVYCGLLPFLAFSESLGKGVNSIRSSSGLIQKVLFPLEFLPFSAAVTSFIDKLFGLVALLAVVLVVQQELHLTTLLLPLIMVPQLVFILGLNYLMAVIGTYLPDTGELLRAVVRAMFFLTPIIWTIDRLEGRENLLFIVNLNPLAYLVEAYRRLILLGELPGLQATLYFSLFAVGIFVVGFGLFVRLKSRFADLL